MVDFLAKLKRLGEGCCVCAMHGRRIVDDKVYCEKCQPMIPCACNDPTHAIDHLAPEYQQCRHCTVGGDQGGCLAEHAKVRVFTGQIQTYQGDDRLDVTRGGNTRKPTWGALFAPSWGILNAELKRRKAGTADAGTWATYCEAYRLEMLDSYRQHRDAWERLLAMSRVTLVCYCKDNMPRCHRVLLSGFLVKMGAKYIGERNDP